MMFYFSTIHVLGIFYISYILDLLLPYPNQLEIKDNTDTVKSASYLDLHLEIVTRRRLITKPYDKLDDFDYPFLSGNIPEAPA